MELHHWPGDMARSLPSYDIGSLNVMAFIKFSNADVKLISTKRSWLSQNGSTLPCLTTPSGERRECADHILQYLRLKYFNPDTWMSPEEKEKILPLTSIIEDKLIPAVKAVFWLDSQNYTEVTRGLYARGCRYPLNFSVPQKIHQQTKEFIQITKHYSDEEMLEVVEKLHKDAAVTLNALSEYLGDKDYMFGNRASSVDALLFSCIAPLLKVSLQSCKLQNHLNGCSNLCKYVTRILRNHFQDELKTNEEKPEETVHHLENEEKYDWIFPVCVAAVAMVSYGVNVGLLQTSRS